MVAGYSASESEDLYILRMFFLFFRKQIFRHFSIDIFETLPHGVTLVSTEPLLHLECPLKQMRGKTPKFCRFPDRVATNLAPPFLGGKEIIVVHDDTKLVGVGLQTTKIDALVYMWGWNILRLLANTALYLGNGTR